MREDTNKFGGSEATPPVHMGQIMSTHEELLEKSLSLLSRLETTAYNMGDWGHRKSAEEIDEKKANLRGYPARYSDLVFRQKEQLERFERIMDFLDSVI